MPQVISAKTFYTSKRTFYIFTFLSIAQEDFQLPIKQLQYQTRVEDKILSCL